MDSERWPWFALVVRTRYEKSVATVLEGKGYTAWCPQYTCLRRWSDRMKEVQFPLFPGYLFCRFDPQNRLPVLTTPGVNTVVNFGKGPAPVPEEDLAQVRRIVESGVTAEPWPYLAVGKKVRVQQGALTGLEGLVVAHKSSWRVVVSIQLLQRSVAAEVDQSWLVPVDEAQSANWAFSRLCMAQARQV